MKLISGKKRMSRIKVLMIFPVLACSAALLFVSCFTAGAWYGPQAERYFPKAELIENRMALKRACDDLKKNIIHVQRYYSEHFFELFKIEKKENNNKDNN